MMWRNKSHPSLSLVWRIVIRIYGVSLILLQNKDIWQCLNIPIVRLNHSKSALIIMSHRRSTAFWNALCCKVSLQTEKKITTENGIKIFNQNEWEKKCTKRKLICSCDGYFFPLPESENPAIFQTAFPLAFQFLQPHVTERQILPFIFSHSTLNE